MTTNRKLMIGGLVVASVTAYMAYAGASSSWQYYLSCEECLADSQSLVGSRLRVNGRVALDSLRTDPDSTKVAFALEGAERNLPVVSMQRLPDNFAEEMDVVVEGRLDAEGLLHAEKVLTRCASKYESQGNS